MRHQKSNLVHVGGNHHPPGLVAVAAPARFANSDERPHRIRVHLVDQVAILDIALDEGADPPFTAGHAWELCQSFEQFHALTLTLAGARRRSGLARAQRFGMRATAGAGTRWPALGRSMLPGR